MLKHAFSSISELSSLDDDLEYQHILSLWDQIVGQLVFENGDIIPDCKVNDEYPRDFSLWALESISKFILYVKKEDNPSRYWEPILTYGYFSPHQNEVFLRDFFIYNIREKGLQKRFFEEWVLIVEFCSQNENWKNANYWHKTELGPSLYGVSQYQLSLWDNDHSDFLKKASEWIMTWFAKNYCNHEVVRLLIILLRKKSGTVFLENGLVVLTAFIHHYTKIVSQPAPENYSHREFKYNESLSKTVSYLWKAIKKQ